MTNREYNKYSGELIIITTMLSSATNEDMGTLLSEFYVEVPTIELFDPKQYLLDQIQLINNYSIKQEQYEICKLLRDITKKINTYK